MRWLATAAVIAAVIVGGCGLQAEGTPSNSCSWLERLLEIMETTSDERDRLGELSEDFYVTRELTPAEYSGLIEREVRPGIDSAHEALRAYRRLLELESDSRARDELLDLVNAYERMLWASGEYRRAVAQAVAAGDIGPVEDFYARHDSLEYETRATNAAADVIALPAFEGCR